MINALLKARAEQAAIHRVADRLDPQVRQQFLAAIDQLRDRIDLQALAKALEKGDIAAAERAIALDGLPDDLQPIVATLRQVFQQAGDIAAEELSAVLRETLRFDLTNPRAVAWASRQGSRLITQISEATRDGVRSLVANGIATGRTPAETAREIRTLVGLTERQAHAVAAYRAELEDGGQAGDLLTRRVARYGQQLLNQRARLIARTETISASSNGQLESWRQAAGDGLLNPAKTRRRWIATEDDRICPICMDLDGATVAFGEPFRTTDGLEVYASPVHPGCLPGDTIVAPCNGIAALSDRRYDGDLLIIRTSAGHDLPCTPNHPILTPSGWIAARFLNVGSDVIGSACKQWESGRRDMHNDDVPSSFHQIAEAARRSKHMSTSEVPLATEDFHGDGLGSKIAIIRTNRLLRNSLDTAIDKHDAKRALRGTGAGNICLSCLRHLRSFSDRMLATCRGLVGLHDLSSALRLRHLRPFQRFSFALTSRSNSSSSQTQPDGVARDAQLVGDLLHGLAGSIAAQHIVSINVRTFSGHVFNLQTGSGSYWANGILTHNCRCTQALEFS